MLGRDQLVRALRSRVKSVVAGNSTGVVYSDNYAQVRSAGDLGERPLIVLTAGKPLPFRDPEMARQAAAYQEVWKNEMQAQLARLSSRGRQVIVEGLVVCLLAGPLGIGLGVLAVELISRFGKLAWVSGDYGMSVFVLAFAVAVGMGMVGAIYPALRAVRITPIEALRYE